MKKKILIIVLIIIATIAIIAIKQEEIANISFQYRHHICTDMLEQDKLYTNIPYCAQPILGYYIAHIAIKLGKYENINIIYIIITIITTLITIHYINKILKAKKYSHNKALMIFLSITILYTIAIGNPEISIGTTLMTMGYYYTIYKTRPILAGILYALSIHIKIVTATSICVILTLYLIKRRKNTNRLQRS